MSARTNRNQHGYLSVVIARPPICCPANHHQTPNSVDQTPELVPRSALAVFLRAANWGRLKSRHKTNARQADN